MYDTELEWITYLMLGPFSAQLTKPHAGNEVKDESVSDSLVVDLQPKVWNLTSEVR